MRSCFVWLLAIACGLAAASPAGAQQSGGQHHRRAARYRPGRDPHPEIRSGAGRRQPAEPAVSAPRPSATAFAISRAAASRSRGGARPRRAAICTATSTRRSAAAADRVSPGLAPGATRPGSRLSRAHTRALWSRRGALQAHRGDAGGDIEAGRALDADRLQRDRVAAAADQNIRPEPRPRPWLARWRRQNCRPARTEPDAAVGASTDQTSTPPLI